MVQLSGNEAPPPTNDAGTSSPNSCAEIAELLSRLQFTPPQLQELYDALADIATSLNKRTHPTSDNEAYDLINADDVPQDVSSEGTGDEATDATSHLPNTAAPSTVAAASVVAASVPEVPVVSVAPTVAAPVDTTVVAASPVVTASPAVAASLAPAAPAPPVSTAAPAAASTTRVFNGVSYQFPADGSSGPFYLVTRGRDIGVFVGWENTSPLVTRVSASVSFRVPSAEEGRVRMESSIAAGFARRV